MSARPFLHRCTSVMVLAGLCMASEARGANISVTYLGQRVTGGNGCSLQEAIYAANFGSNLAISGINSDGTDRFVATNCQPGTGNDTIILPQNATLYMNVVVDDAHNAVGPTATPFVFSTVTIEANGATLMWTGQHHARAFAVGSATVRF